jgi:hypothetical protein
MADLLSASRKAKHSRTRPNIMQVFLLRKFIEAVNPDFAGHTAGARKKYRFGSGCTRCLPKRVPALSHQKNFLIQLRKVLHSFFCGVSIRAVQGLKDASVFAMSRNGGQSPMGVLLITICVSPADREDLLRTTSFYPKQNPFSFSSYRNSAHRRVSLALTTQALPWRRLYVCPALR